MSNYLIGLFIGLHEVGYSVCDEGGRLLRFKGENMWGVSRIHSALTGEESAFQTDWIRPLQAYFSPAVMGSDPAFFERVQQGGYDKRNAWPLLSGSASKIKEWKKQYPTVYHLRERLAHEKNGEDARLVYLALHHILKRGGSPGQGIRTYEKHKEDLAFLKKVYRKYAPKRYSPMFHHANPCANYVGYRAMPPVCTKQAFYDRIRAELAGPRRFAPELLRCFSEIENATFLPRAGDFSSYEPPAAWEVSQILENQGRTNPFFRRERRDIESLCGGRRMNWISERRKEARDCVRGMVKEIVKIQGAEPKRIFIAYHAEYEEKTAAAVSPFPVNEICRCPIFLVGTDFLEKAKAIFGLTDSRAVNDYFFAQNAFAVSMLGDCVVSDMAGTKPRGGMQPLGREKCAVPDPAVILRHPELAEKIRRTFAYKSFFESGLPQTSLRYEQGMRARHAGADVWEKENGRLERILYDGTEYGVLASGELVCLTQIMLPARLIDLLNLVLEKKEIPTEAELVALYEELLDKAERFIPFYKHTKAFSDALRTWFSALPAEDKRRSIISLLQGVQAGRPCGIFIEHLPLDRVMRIDRSITGMFEQKRKLAST